MPERGEADRGTVIQDLSVIPSPYLSGVFDLTDTRSVELVLARGCGMDLRAPGVRHRSHPAPLLVERGQAPRQDPQALFHVDVVVRMAELLVGNFIRAVCNHFVRVHEYAACLQRPWHQLRYVHHR